MERLTTLAKKYEVLGKKTDELAAKLYEYKKMGGTVYNDFAAILDESLATVEKGGMFGEIGSSRSGSAGAETALRASAAEIAKANSGAAGAAALVKAWEGSPELAAQYEAEYKGGK
jgi:hypothetical protein